MARRVLTPKGDGKPIGMYSAGFDVDAGRLVFVAGQVAMDATGRLVGEGDIAAQAGQVYRNLEAILREAGCGWRDVVKFTTFLTPTRTSGRSASGGRASTPGCSRTASTRRTRAWSSRRWRARGCSWRSRRSP